MAKVRARPETGTLYLDFFFQGKRCREQTNLPDSTGNRKKLRKILERLEAEITLGTFDYSRYFPNSKFALRFATNPTTETALLLQPVRGVGTNVVPAMVQAAPFRDFANHWYAQHEIEWRRSYRPTVLGAIDQHLIPRFGEIDVGLITREEILNFRSALGKLPGRKSKNGLSAQRINHVMGVLRRVLEDAADRFHFTSPYQRIKPLKLTKSDVEPFTPAEVQQILQTVRKDFRTYLLVRFAAGMRTRGSRRAQVALYRLRAAANPGTRDRGQGRAGHDQDLRLGTRHRCHPGRLRCPQGATRSNGAPIGVRFLQSGRQTPRSQQLH